TRGSDGRLTVKNKDLKKEILDLRRDPKLSALMAGEYAKDNEQVLESKLGRQVSTHDLYLAHFLGAGGALKVLKGRNQPDTDQQPPELAGAARANPEVFQDPSSGEQRSLGSVYSAVAARFRRAMSDAAHVATRLRPQVDLAALKPDSRPEVADAPATLLTQTEVKTADAARTMEGIPSTTSSYPARLPPRHAAADIPAAERGAPFPVALPPPMTGARADAGTLRSLMSMMEDKS
ncbi:MAG: lytic transglycosylase domain-containing protein, partial [Magnetospirillum sp.]|nr:lytic transglycosylase domain-containing protein [Magnetospirillum sp.]